MQDKDFYFWASQRMLEDDEYIPDCDVKDLIGIYTELSRRLSEALSESSPNGAVNAKASIIMRATDRLFEHIAAVSDSETRQLENKLTAKFLKPKLSDEQDENGAE